MSLDQLKVPTKLGLITGVMFVPLVLMTWFFYHHASVDVTIAQQERDGVTYLRGAWHVTNALTTAASDPATTPLQLMKNAPDMAKLGKQFNAEMGTTEAARGLANALALVGWPNRPLRADEADKIIAEARTLITKIADGSKLTLDPQLDSFYVMDAVTTKLPETLDRARQLLALLHAHKTHNITDEERAEFLVQLALFRNAVEGASGSLQSAYKANTEGTTRANLEGSGTSFTQLTAQFAEEIRAIAVILRDPEQRKTADLGPAIALYAQSQLVTDTLWHAAANELDRLLAARYSSSSNEMWQVMGATALAALLAFFLTFYVSRGLATSLSRMTAAMDRLAHGDFGIQVEGTERKDEMGLIARTLVHLRDSGAKAARDFEESVRIKVALDNCSTNVMVADTNGTILFANKSVLEMMKGSQTEIRKSLKSFDVDKMVGANFDIFHANPGHQRAMLEKLSSTYKTSIKVAGKIFNLSANPVLDGEGRKLGFVVEWHDVTEERAVEAEIDALVTAAVAGNFRERISLDGKQGFMRSLADAMNRLCATTASALDEVNANLSALAEGDLTKRVTSSYDGMFEELKTNVNTMTDRLSGIVDEVVVAANEVANAASEITTGTNDLSQRTEQQASNLQQTAASMEEMASTIKQNADNAAQANQLAIGARSVASDGGDIVSRAVTAMSRIEDSSQKISEIIGVIDAIAFQTNLLALNAAVEAARAGDAGKGFAVVASEVRLLAQRSSEAAKNIKDLIVQSSGQVKDDVKLVNDAGSALTEIVTSVKRVADIISEIAAASKEQSTGVEEINRAVSQMDEMTQQNSALVEENAAASHTLQEQAQTLREHMSFFSTGNAQTTGPRTSGKESKTVTAMPKARSKALVPAPRPPVKKVAAAGGVARMQAELQEAFEDDADWKEF
ncbi:MAG: methyl-accepting chemotaxis protein [Hyphomicrobiaceae bacterium]